MVVGDMIDSPILDFMLFLPLCFLNYGSNEEETLITPYDIDIFIIDVSIALMSIYVGQF